jgi:hypothetical protein
MVASLFAVEKYGLAWSGRFLALLCPALPEPVLLEFPAE